MAKPSGGVYRPLSVELDLAVSYLRHYSGEASALPPQARAVLRNFPVDIRRELGKAIFDLQKGRKLSMPVSRPMPAIAPGVEELRVKDRSGAYRVFHFARLETAVLIFHAFKKKTAKTPLREIELARTRLKEML